MRVGVPRMIERLDTMTVPRKSCIVHLINYLLNYPINCDHDIV